MGLEISSWNPNNNEIITYPYIISKNYYKAAGLAGSLFNGSFDYALENSVNNLKDMFKIIILREEAKEENFINTFLYTIEQNDKEFYNKIKAFYIANPDKSKVIDMIQKYRMDLLKKYESIEESLKNFDKNWSLFYNKTFLEALNNIKISDPLNLTIDQFITSIERQIQDNFKKKVSNVSAQSYKAFLGNVFNEIRSLSKTKFGQDYFKNLDKLKDNIYIKAKITEHSKQGKTQDIYEIIKGYLFGILNGLSAEQFLVSFGSDSSTGRFMQPSSTLTGRNQSAAVAIKTDTLEIVNVDLEFNPLNQTDIINDMIAQNKATSQNLYDYINKIDEQTAFIIHTSIKDQSTNKNYGTGRSMQIDITKSASLDTRLKPLQDIAYTVKSNQNDIQKLIFAIANAGDYMIASGLKNNIIIGITSLCAAYMFEDYIDTFSQFETETSNKHLHLYFINGKYYTISDILTLSLNSLTSSGKNKYVKVSFHPTKINEFNTSDVNSYHGKDKWEQVRINTLRHGYMSVRLDTNALLNAIYPN